MERLKEGWNAFWKEEEGLGTLEILLIVAVLIIIAIAFRKWILKWLKALFESADKEIVDQSGTISKDAGDLSPKAP
ncbi:Flp1 family type IVb pilin [Paenibacillus filicis]|uniref:Flp1 family type IVb pilin n=2 Tax=Paenibacillus gyeongsangnamensis TaxID=3388067 RepID=A0ABT4QG75_9BACL|nr:Flp1 family type IVb pilin [Paenibacillus filicis]MCZ8515873.1 Flp1 family type IVb pilin [Paenibacillus filicis]